MKTLVLHIGDASKDFLKLIYQDISQKKVITDFISREDLLNEIENHDAIIIMGNGGSNGIWGLNFTDDNFIDSSILNYLKPKKSLIFIWFNSYQFLKDNNFNHSNMLSIGNFISEPLEVIFLDKEVPLSDINTYESIIEHSNFTYSKQLGSLLKEYGVEDLSFIYSEFKKLYKSTAQQNEVAAFNYERLYYSWGG